MNQNEVSFRGIPVPEVIKRVPYQVSDSQQVIDKISQMKAEDRGTVTLSGIHYDDRGISDVKLSTGDIVPIETAIALAENYMLKGYSTGKTMQGGRTLRSKPSADDKDYNYLHDLPQF